MNKYIVDKIIYYTVGHKLSFENGFQFKKIAETTQCQLSKIALISRKHRDIIYHIRYRELDEFRELQDIFLATGKIFVPINAIINTYIIYGEKATKRVFEKSENKVELASTYRFCSEFADASEIIIDNVNRNFSKKFLEKNKDAIMNFYKYIQFKYTNLYVFAEKYSPSITATLSFEDKHYIFRYLLKSNKSFEELKSIAKNIKNFDTFKSFIVYEKIIPLFSTKQIWKIVNSSLLDFQYDDIKILASVLKKRGAKLDIFNIDNCAHIIRCISIRNMFISAGFKVEEWKSIPRSLPFRSVFESADIFIIEMSKFRLNTYDLEYILENNHFNNLKCSFVLLSNFAALIYPLKEYFEIEKIKDTNNPTFDYITAPNLEAMYRMGIYKPQLSKVYKDCTIPFNADILNVHLKYGNYEEHTIREMIKIADEDNVDILHKYL